MWRNTGGWLTVFGFVDAHTAWGVKNVVRWRDSLPAAGRRAPFTRSRRFSVKQIVQIGKILHLARAEQYQTSTGLAFDGRYFVHTWAMPARQLGNRRAFAQSFYWFDGAIRFV